MEREQPITTDIVVASWQCPRKAFFMLENAQKVLPPELELIIKKKKEKARAQYLARLREKHGDVISYTPGLFGSEHRVLYNAVLEYEHLLADIDVLMKVDGGQRSRKATYTPILVVGTHSVTNEHKIVLTFAGLILSRLQHQPCAAGKVVTSKGRIQSVRFGNRKRQILANIRNLGAWLQEALPSAPGVMLNKHCPMCPFSLHCHAEAIQTDHLSLLPGMRQKQIKDYNKKGIFTVTQLAYSYRARKRRRRDTQPPLKYKHALKALAIRDHKIYMVEMAQQEFNRPLIFLDVEGIPDQRFYYLIGLLVVTRAGDKEHSFWADRENDEEKIWRQFLSVVSAHDEFTIFHYGHYEKRFIEVMARRYNDEEKPVVDKISSRLVNVLGLIYGSIYFPAFSNGLKEIGRYIGHEWTHSDASGLQSIVWRYRWEASRDHEWKQVLITYNQEDCRAVKNVLDMIGQIQQGTLEMINDVSVEGVDRIVSTSTYKFGKNDFMLSDFEHINDCAYFNYQRERVYFRTAPKRREKSTGGKILRPRRRYRTNKKVEIPIPERCERCGSTALYRHGPQQKTVHDLRFTDSGVRRWVVRYRTRRVRCRNCSHVTTSEEYKSIRGKYGHDFYAMNVYSTIELQQSHGRTAKMYGVLFGYKIRPMDCAKARKYFADLYQETHEKILSTLRQGTLVHVDETSINMPATTSYIWVFASTTEVAYVYSRTREGDVPRQHLVGVSGVLVSDFFSAYDALDCRKQRCLIHLIRDMNDDLRKNPFDAEFKLILQQFGVLVRTIIGTIDRFGLRKRYLRKHRKDVNRFYRSLSGADLHSEAAIQYKNRLVRWKGELFTFLDYDGVPWNNNNAEHAVKAIAYRRKSGTGFFTEAGMRRFLILLSVFETCRYRGINFLEFLRSGRTDLLDYPSLIMGRRKGSEIVA